MFTISRDDQALYITIVAKDRLPVFQSDSIKQVACRAIDEARTSGEILLFAYVVMRDHMHLMTNASRKSSETLRYLKGTISHRVIEYLKEKGFNSSLEKLRHGEGKRNHHYSLWQHKSNVLQIYSESVFMQKVNYIHLNPVRAGIVESGVDYHWSSARCWRHCELDREPLFVDVGKIKWRRPK